MKIALTILASAALLVPASSALAANQPGKAQGPKQAQQAKQNQAGKARAYGKYCQDQSKKRVKGEKGTPFSRCVVGVAQMRRD